MPQKNLKMKCSKNGLVVFPRVLYPIIMLIVLAVDIYILVNTLNMQKESYNCKCAQNWELKQVSNSIITIISLQVSLILIGLFINFIYKHTLLLLFAALIIIALFLIKLYYVITMLMMIHKLDKNNCLCVDPTFKTNLTYYAGIRAFLVVVGIISLVSKIMLMNKK
jgi:hypothetical protein